MVVRRNSFTIPFPLTSMQTKVLSWSPVAVTKHLLLQLACHEQNFPGSLHLLKSFACYKLILLLSHLFASLDQSSLMLGSAALCKNTVGLANVDLGRLINFIKHEPPHTEHSKERLLWEFRCNHGMCPHCGNKTHKRKGMLRRGFVPLTIPGYADRGVCIHPHCTCCLRACVCV
jgi:hypothetical protein